MEIETETETEITRKTPEKKTIFSKDPEIFSNINIEHFSN